MMRALVRTTFFRHASILQAAGFLRFAISFIGSVLIARLLGPNTYGTYALAVAFMGMLGLLLDAGQGSGALILFARALAQNSRERMREAGSAYFKTVWLLYVCIGVPFILAA